MAHPLFGTAPESRWPRWVIGKADWQEFSSSLVVDETPNLSVDEEVSSFTESLISAARNSIPLSSTRPRRPPVPWWNEECKLARREKNSLFSLFKRNPTQENMVAYQRSKARLQRIVKMNKRMSWRNYVSTVTSSTPSAKVWEKVRKISGNSCSPAISGLSVNGTIITDAVDVANTLGEVFASISSSENFPPEFVTHKRVVESSPLNFLSGNHEDYNLLFSGYEMDSALLLCKDSSPGPDAVHYQMLKHLPDSFRSKLLNLYNKMWIEGTYPASWKESFVIPVPKAGKDRKSASNYRPISLTSCVSKLLERMISKRLIWFLESNGLLNNTQCGFRRHRSTVDHLVRLETAIRNAFLNKQHLVAVFFDLEKAYDTTWRFGILRTLHSWGVRGRMMRFIEDFMSDRRFRVRVGCNVSQFFGSENGVPQGSILSVILFLIAMNGAAECVKSPVDCSLFVDDFAIYSASRSKATVERQLQLTINRLHTWATEHGFRFSASKTVCVHFCKVRSCFIDPLLALNGTQLPFSDTAKFLGLIFDRKLTFRQHFASLKKKCNMSLNILRVLTNKSWGADRVSMLRLYRSLVRSKLDYGCQVYASARPTHLRALDTVHHSGIRIATGAFRTSPIPSLLCEAGEPPLSSRRMLLSLRYVTSLQAKPLNPAHEVVLYNVFDGIYEARPRTIRPLGLRTQDMLRELDFELPLVACVTFCPKPPWLLKRPFINYSLSKLDRHTTLPFEYQLALQKTLFTRVDSTLVFTDGSKSNDLVGCSFVVGNREYMYRLHPVSSVYTAELYAIYKALNFVLSELNGPVIILSDSLSSLQALEIFEPVHPLVRRIRLLLEALHSRGVQVEFFWVPGHVGISGNEMADKSAKAASMKPTIDVRIAFVDDVNACLKQLVLDNWQRTWTNTTHNKLRVIKGDVKPWESSCRINRREETAITRLRIGHCWWTQGYLLRGEEPPICETCNVVLNVAHILIDCVQFADARERSGLSWEMSLALGDNATLMDRLILFLKCSGVMPFV